MLLLIFLGGFVFGVAAHIAIELLREVTGWD